MRRKKLIIPVAVILVALILIGIYAWSASQPITIQTSPAWTQDVTVKVTSDGSVVSAHSQDIFPVTEGRLENVAVTDGATVKQGDELARLEAGPLRAAVKMARADLEAARAMPTGTDRLDDARDAAISAAKISLTQAETMERGAVITAPQDGIVQFNTLGKSSLGNGSVTPARGLAVSPTMPLMRVYSPAEPLFRAQVSDVDIVGVRVDATGSVSLDAAPTTALPAKVSTITSSPTTTSGGTTYLTDLTLTSENWVRIGMTGSVDIDVTVADALVVPNASLVSRGASRFVYVIADGRAHETVVTVGSTSGNLTIITSGLHDGDKVATTGASGLSDGARVSVEA